MSSRRQQGMKKFKLLLLDANIVIKAFELGIWQELIE